MVASQTPVVQISKVAQVGVLFWLIKMMSTTVGETGADFLIFKLHWGLLVTALVMLAPLILALYFQLSRKLYSEWRYWFAVVMVSVQGTLITDLLTDKLKVPLAISSLVFSLMLLGVFSVWYKREKTLSIQTINTGQREVFYWIAVITTFALGTAVGDWLSEGLNWGYKFSGYIFAGLILLPLLGWLLGQHKILCFWVAYVLTRPLGASLGDWLSHSPKHGGLGFGTTHTSEIFLLLIFVAVAWLARNNSSASIKSTPTSSNNGG